MHYLEIARRVIARQRSQQGVAVAEPVALRNSPPDLDDYLYIFYERAAIGEYDGGLSRTAAERQALGEILAIVAAQRVRTTGDTGNGYRT